MTFTKYEFQSPTEWATYKAQITDTEGNPVNCAIVEIGNICLAHDEEGNCTDISPLYAVDILWESNPLPEFEQYEVYPKPCGVHTFMGCEGLYEIEYNRYNS